MATFNRYNPNTSQWEEITLDSQNHHVSHELNGSDEIDVTKLRNYAEQITTPITGLQGTTSNHETRIQAIEDDNLDSRVLAIENENLDSRVDTLETSSTTFLKGAGQKVEVLELSFPSNGTAATITSTGTFTKTYTVPPTILPGNVTQAVGYSDVILHPYIFNVTTTGFQVNLKTYNTTSTFASGTVKMKFMVIGL